MPSYNKQNQLKARSLRNNSSKYESKIWYTWLRNIRPQWYRQYPIGNYILDYYCKEFKICIEIDGMEHQNKTEYDSQRDLMLLNHGIKTFRFGNYIAYHEPSVCIYEVLNYLASRGNITYCDIHKKKVRWFKPWS